MASRSVSRALWGVLYLGLVFSAAGWIYGRLTQFEGQLLIERGRTESVVVRPSGEEAFFGIQRNMPLELILFDNPKAVAHRLDRSLAYDAMTLPFHLRLDEARVTREFAPEDVLEVGALRTATPYPIAVGTEIPAGEQTIRVEALRRWSGLVRNPAGQPAVAFSVRRPGEPWIERLVSYDHQWAFVEPGFGAQLLWQTARETADALDLQAPELLAGRWGIVEGKRVQWQNSFVPGTGATMPGPLEVTLLQHDLAHETPQGPQPAIEVSLRYQEEERRVWTVANQRAPEGRIQYEYPAALEQAVLILAWRDGAARVVAYRAGALVESLELQEGGQWRPDGCPYEIRIDQVMRDALLVSAGAQADVQEALLKAGDERVGVREGVSAPLAGTTVRYRRVPVAPEAEYTLTAVRDGEELKSAVLTPGRKVRVDQWVFSLGPPNIDARNSALLLARRTGGGPLQWLGLFAFVGGAFALVLLRFWPGRSRPAVWEVALPMAQEDAVSPEADAEPPRITDAPEEPRA